MNRCVIIANGLIEDIGQFEELLKNADVIICADGGLNHLDKIGIYPTMLMGDMDSISQNLLSKYASVERLTFPTRKDATDSELAIDYAVGLAPKEIILLGMTGRRLDHGLTNLHMLKRIPRNIKASVIDAHNKVYYCDSDFVYTGCVGELLSIVPITQAVHGITTRGLDYPLVNETLFFRESRGVSNVVKSPDVRIEARSGEFFVILSKD